MEEKRKGKEREREKNASIMIHVFGLPVDL